MINLAEGDMPQFAVVAAAAHELKSPLTLISYIAQTLNDPDMQLTAAQRAKYGQQLEIISKRTLSLLQQITTSYRLQHDSQLCFDFNVQPVNIREVCEAVLHEFSPYAAQYQQKLVLVKPRGGLNVVAQRDVMFDIVGNLVDNAIKHNPPQGTVAVHMQRNRQYVRLYVKNSGEALKKAEFNQLRRTLGVQPQPFKGHGSSSGLGLYVAGQLAQAMGGAVGVSGRRGGGFFAEFIRSHQLNLL